MDKLTQDTLNLRAGSETQRVQLSEDCVKVEQLAKEMQLRLKAPDAPETTLKPAPAADQSEAKGGHAAAEKASDMPQADVGSVLKCNPGFKHQDIYKENDVCTIHRLVLNRGQPFINVWWHRTQQVTHHDVPGVFKELLSLVPQTGIMPKSGIWKYGEDDHFYLTTFEHGRMMGNWEDDYYFRNGGSKFVATGSKHWQACDILFAGDESCQGLFSNGGEPSGVVKGKITQDGTLLQWDNGSQWKFDHALEPDETPLSVNPWKGAEGQACFEAFCKLPRFYAVTQAAGPKRQKRASSDFVSAVASHLAEQDGLEKRLRTDPYYGC